MKMKRSISIVLMLLVCMNLLAEEGSTQVRIGLFSDLSVIDTLWTDHWYLHGGIRLGFEDSLVLELPLTFVSGVDGHQLLDTGLLCKYYPFDSRFWLGATLFQGITLLGDERPNDWYLYLQEFSSGYTIPITEGLYLEPSINLRDPNGIFHDSLSSVSEYLPGYSRLRFCLNLGWRGVSLTLR